MAAAYPMDDPQGSAAVHITEFGDIRVNPQPIVKEEDTDVLLEEYLSPRKLKEMTGVDDLEDIKYLEMRVDTMETSLGNFGGMVPNLKQLKLNNSIIATVRDLGTSLDTLSVLWMSRCCLCDLDGISSMSSLQELYLAYNDITDISPVSMLDNLRLLDLEGNNLEEVSQVEFLALCSKLATLTLEGNPVCLAPSPDYNKEESGEFDYRAAVRKAIPHLKILDEEPLSVVPSSLKDGVRNRSTDWLIVNEAIKEGIGSNESLETPDGRPSSASRRRPGSARPGSARPGTSIGMRPGSSMGNRPGSSMGNRPWTSAGQRPDTAGSDIQSTGDDCSDLTYGSGGVICGNPVRALRKRRKKQDSYDFQPAIPSLFVAVQHQPDHSYYTEDEDGGQSKDDIFAELRAWKEDHERKVTIRQKEREPQILTITHDDEDDNNNEDGLMDYEDDLGIHSVTPPANSPDAEFGRMPSPPQRLGSPKAPVQSHKGPVRPKTASGELGFRMRRYKHRSMDDGLLVEQLGSMRLSQDDDAMTEDSGHSSPHFLPYSPPPFPNQDSRPFSGPATVNRTHFKNDPSLIKTQPKIIDRHNPVVRSSTHTPPGLAQRLPGLLRPVTAKAALQRQPLSINRQPKT